MELELGLAPPNHLMKGFDLNTPTDIWAPGCGLSGTNKRGFHEAFHKAYAGAVIKTLPLFCKNEPHDHDDDEDDGNGDGVGGCIINSQPSFHVNKSRIVGWPPIKSSRHAVNGDGGRDEGSETKGSYVGSNSLYVKVKMDGIAIGRKVDLALHESYQTLTRTLDRMFGINEKIVNGDDAQRPSYRITYQDEEGDWLHVGDVPWQTFIRSVQRLKIQKIGY